MDIQTSIKTVLTKKYATFTGRASRSEYWWFVLAYVIVGVVIQLLGVWILSAIYFLALIIPALAVAFRRMQDTGRPGWYIVIPAAISLLIGVLSPTMPAVDASMGMNAATGTVTGTGPDMSQVGGMMGSMALLAILGIVEFILAVIFIYWLTRPSEPQTNTYGPPPQA